MKYILAIILCLLIILLSCGRQELQIRNENPDCASNLYDCKHFATQQEAQAMYKQCILEKGVDVHHLDGDSDGKACEWNP